MNYRANNLISILLNTGGIKSLDICEIGCSYGSFLDLIKYGGGNPYGVELDYNACSYLQSKNYAISDVIDINQKYHVVCMFQVLEHLLAPSEMIDQIAHVLYPDGRLLISIPNAGEYNKIGHSWVGFRVDFEHLNYFNLRNLSDMLLPHGLYIEHFWSHNQPIVPRMLHGTKYKAYNFFPKLKGAATIKRLFWKHDIMTQGSFVLTALARKAHPNKPV